jgi:hypothetical protein
MVGRASESSAMTPEPGLASLTMRVFDGRLHVHYGQAYVFSGDDGDTGEMEACFRGQTNGLLGAGQAGMLFLLTGLHTGFVDLTVDVDEHEPPLDESREECVEVSFAPAAPEVRVVDWDRGLVCELALPGLSYRVRYAARGMDAGHAEDTIIGDEEPVDSYRLWFWPAPHAPDRVLEQTSGAAAYWHNWAQNL